MDSIAINAINTSRDYIFCKAGTNTRDFHSSCCAPLSCKMMDSEGGVMRLVLAFLVLALVGGCAQYRAEQQARAAAMAQAQAASDDAQCRSYGAQSGSQMYIQCRMSLDQQRQQTRAALAAAILSRPAPQPYYLPPPQPIVTSPPMNCTSTPIGNTVSTHCY
jgi:hypothetical protein